jgi:hypothetical protein
MRYKEPVTGYVRFVCEQCESDLCTTETDLSKAYAEAREDGWKSSKTNNEELNLCPHCAQSGVPKSD